jgi:hypothetical protein
MLVSTTSKPYSKTRHRVETHEANLVCEQIHQPIGITLYLQGSPVLILFRRDWLFPFQGFLLLLQYCHDHGNLLRQNFVSRDPQLSNHKCECPTTEVLGRVTHNQGSHDPLDLVTVLVFQLLVSLTIQVVICWLPSI